MSSDIVQILLISGSIINTFVIALLIIKKKINIAISLASLQALIWVFKLMGLF